MLSRGRSFRTTLAEDLVGPQSGYFRIFAETEGRKGQTSRLGLERTGKFWKARLNGADIHQLSRLLQSLPVVLMEPNSHLLVSGPPEVRRKYLDRGMFHVEQRFLNTWRQYSKVLKQRNAALKNRQLAVLEALDQLIAEVGTELGRQREVHFKEISERVSRLLGTLNASQAQIDLDYREGWNERTLMEALQKGRKRDLDKGMTVSGPHRADIQIQLKGNAAKAHLSRGEQKIVSAAFLLAQAEIIAENCETPVILLDDLASEFDQVHHRNVLKRAVGFGGQVWVTGTERQDPGEGKKVFHVEHGKVTEVI